MGMYHIERRGDSEPFSVIQVDESAARRKGGATAAINVYASEHLPRSAVMKRVREYEDWDFRVRERHGKSYTYYEILVNPEELEDADGLIGADHPDAFTTL